MIKEVYDTFTITKENYTIYRLFDELMTDAKTGKIFKSEEIIPEPTWDDEFYVGDVFDIDPFTLTEADEEALTNLYKQNKAGEINQKLIASPQYKMLYQDGVIIWHSDDAPLESADFLRISQVEDGYLLEFTRPNQIPEKSALHFPGSIDIRFSNSGSRYGDLVTLFTRMCNKLNEYDQDYHQIHLEEIAYQKN